MFHSYALWPMGLLLFIDFKFCITSLFIMLEKLSTNYYFFCVNYNYCSVFLFQIRFVCEILTCIGCSITLVADIFEIVTQGIFSFLKNCVSIHELFTLSCVIFEIHNFFKAKKFFIFL